MSKSQIGRRPTPDHVPGSIEEAAARIYFERGTKEAVERNRWALSGILNASISVLLLIALISLILNQKIYVFQADKDPAGRISVSEVATSFKADEDTQMAWASAWVATLTEITPALWQRNVKLVQSKSAGVALDQIKAYLQRAENNPAQLVHRYPTYVREYKRGSVNKVTGMTYLIRYELLSRPAPGIDPQTKSYAMTVTLTHVGHKSRDDVFSNPEGLTVLNFSVSEEAR
ncbi:type IV secretion system protein [Hydrogenophaga sp. NFH-34]|uniref:type IV secretion system protein n=1 Tax=Hydrogenophaga sp. NFH-34 TaxID=2744446 RepID=UPI001F3ACB81|nr:type IV secretion system protein [Hydrogenophaga sp. NFH-34]